MEWLKLTGSDLLPATRSSVLVVQLHIYFGGNTKPHCTNIYNLRTREGGASYETGWPGESAGVSVVDKSTFNILETDLSIEDEIQRCLENPKVFQAGAYNASQMAQSFRYWKLSIVEGAEKFWRVHATALLLNCT